MGALNLLSCQGKDFDLLCPVVRVGVGFGHFLHELNSRNREPEVWVKMAGSLADCRIRWPRQGHDEKEPTLQVPKFLLKTAACNEGCVDMGQVGAGLSRGEGELGKGKAA